MRPEHFLTVLALLLAAVAIYSVTHGYAIFDYFKPMTTVAIITLAAWRGPFTSFGKWMITGLLFGLLGDIFLLRETYFVYGLGAFLVTHACFTVAIAQRFGNPRRPEVGLSLLAFGALYYFLLWENLGELALPVAVYFGVILLMVYFAIGHYRRRPDRLRRLLALAALLFVVSDGLIGYNKFVAPVSGAQLLILGTYWLSVGGFAWAVVWERS